MSIEFDSLALLRDIKNGENVSIDINLICDSLQPVQFRDPKGLGRPTHFVDTSHEWLQKNLQTCICNICGHEAPANNLIQDKIRCKPKLSPVSWLPLKLQPFE